MDDNKNKLASLGKHMTDSANLLNPEDKYLPEGIDGIKRTHANTTKYHAAAMAVSDAADDTHVTYSDEELKYKMSAKQFLVAILITAVLIGILQLIPFAAELIYPDFVENTQYEFDTKANVAYNVSYLESLGIDMDVAAVDEPITFTYRNSIGPIKAIFGNKWISIHAVRSFGNMTILSNGDEISCNFRSYPAPSGTGNSSRYVVITVNGKEVRGYISEKNLLQLYKTALKRNDLKDEFKKESGMLFMNASLRKELTKADRQIFEKGIYRPYGYPYHTEKLDVTCNYLSIAAFFVVLIAFTAVNLMRKKKANDAYLKKWNEESKRRWEEKQLNKE
ncbi:MAG: hypothetical protein E7430_03915 [Ruminococcaceae bacterium]|nr:hypothetical protein [Oscillospiraceae bacterium]